MQAVADFTTVLKLDPTNVNAYFNRGSAYDSLGQYEKAVADYTHALDLDSSSPDPDRSAGGHACHVVCFSNMQLQHTPSALMSRAVNKVVLQHSACVQVA